LNTRQPAQLQHYSLRSEHAAACAVNTRQLVHLMRGSLRSEHGAACEVNTLSELKKQRNSAVFKVPMEFRQDHNLPVRA